MASSDKLINVEHGEKETTLRIGDHFITWNNSILNETNIPAIAYSIECLTNKYTNSQDMQIDHIKMLTEILTGKQ